MAQHLLNKSKNSFYKRWQTRHVHLPPMPVKTLLNKQTNKQIYRKEKKKKKEKSKECE